MNDWILCARGCGTVVSREDIDDMVENGPWEDSPEGYRHVTCPPNLEA